MKFDSKTLATLGDGPHANYIRGLIDGVRDNARDGGAPAQVAALAVRGITHTSGVEWAVLVETFGIPTTADWEMAQRAYGPTKGLPGLGHVCDTCPFTSSDPDAIRGHEAGPSTGRGWFGKHERHTMVWAETPRGVAREWSPGPDEADQPEVIMNNVASAPEVVDAFLDAAVYPNRTRTAQVPGGCRVSVEDTVRGLELSSYRTVVAIRLRGRDAVAVTTRRYSVTTSKLIGRIVRDLISRGYQCAPEVLTIATAVPGRWNGFGPAWHATGMDSTPFSIWTI